MDDSHLVHGSQRVADLQRHGNRRQRGELPPRGEQALEGPPFEVLHDDVRGAVLQGPGVEDLDHPRVVNRRERPRLSSKPGAPLR